MLGAEYNRNGILLVLGEIVQIAQECLLGSDVEGGERFVEHEKAGPTEQGPRELEAVAGLHVGDDCRLLIAELPEEHPFVQHELLMPVLGIVRYPDVASAIAGAVRTEHGFGHTATMYSQNVEALSAMARTANCSIFVKNGSHLAGLGYGGEGYTSFTIASPTGEGLTTALSFTRERRCTMKDAFRFV